MQPNINETQTNRRNVGYPRLRFDLGAGFAGVCQTDVCVRPGSDRCLTVKNTLGLSAVLTREVGLILLCEIKCSVLFGTGYRSA